MSNPNDFDTQYNKLFTRCIYNIQPVECDISASTDDINKLTEHNGQKTDIVVEKVIKNNKRCFECKSKLSLIQIECNKCLCGGVYCSKHRLAEQHSCSYDYKTDGKKLLEKRNPRIVAEKLNKI